MSLATTAAVVGIAGGVNSLLNSGNNGAGAANQASANASDASAAAQAQQAAIAQDQWNYYKTNYQPLETSLINQASTAGSPEQFAQAEGQANANVTSSFNDANKQTASTLQSYGINPGSPAYQSAVASGNTAMGAAKAGALTTADQNVRNLAYSKALDVVGIGRNIPAQSAASSGSAATNANQSAAVNNSRSGTLYGQNTSTQQNIGYGLSSVMPMLNNAATAWYGASGVPGLESQYGSSNVYTPTNSPGSAPTFNPDSMFAKGGRVFDAKKTGPTQFDATQVKSVLMKHGLNPRVAHVQAHGAAKRTKQYFTPHQRAFAGGGGVGRQGLDGSNGDPGPDASNMGVIPGPGTETSDSVPAQIDGQQPAALSKNEFVMNAEVPKMTGEEILAAINNAGLQKRQQRGIEPRSSNDVPSSDGAEAYARGGRVNYRAYGLGA